MQIRKITVQICGNFWVTQYVFMEVIVLVSAGIDNMFVVMQVTVLISGIGDMFVIT